MTIYSLVDSREIDRYLGALFFKNLEDAEKMRKSTGNDERYFDIHHIEVIE